MSLTRRVHTSKSQEQKQKQLVAVVSALLRTTLTSGKKQGELLEDPLKFCLLQEHDLFQVLKKEEKKKRKKKRKKKKGKKKIDGCAIYLTFF